MATSNPLAAPAANTSKRDFLIALETTAQQKWAQGKLFETNSPYTDGSEVVPSENFSEDAARVRAERPKWFGTFPYPVRSSSSLAPASLALFREKADLLPLRWWVTFADRGTVHEWIPASWSCVHHLQD